MLLAASLIVYVTCTDLNVDGLEFLSQLMSLHAQTFLNSHLEVRDIDCTISSSLATILVHGSFTWSNEVTTSDLVLPVILSKDIMSNNSLFEGIVRYYSIKHEVSNKSLSKLIKI